MTGPSAFGTRWWNDNAPLLGADNLGRTDILGGPQRQYLSPHQSRQVRPTGDAQHRKNEQIVQVERIAQSPNAVLLDQRIAESNEGRLQSGSQEDRQKYMGKRLQKVNRPHDQRIYESAHIRAGCSNHDAQDKGHRCGDHRNHDSRAPARQDTRKHIASEFVRAQRMQPGGGCAMLSQS